MLFRSALLGATRKIRLPGMTATMSLNFLFILIAVVEFSFSESVVLAAATALVQSLWKPSKRPTLAQVAFGAGTMLISTALTYSISHLVLAPRPAAFLSAALMLSTALLLMVNTALVARVISLVESKRFIRVWRDCYLMAFPYFLIGAALAGAVCSTCGTLGWHFRLLLLPLTYLLYLFYRLHLERQQQREPATLSESAAD